MSLRGTIVKSKSLSDLESLTFAFKNPHDEDGVTSETTFNDGTRFSSNNKPIVGWKIKLLDIIDAIERTCNKRSLSPILFRRNNPQLMFYVVLTLLILTHIFTHIHSHYHQSQYNNAYTQSYGLFQHITNYHWKELKENYRMSNPHKFGTVETFIDDPSVWFQYNWNKNFVCPQEERIGISPSNGGGELGDGPKWVCNPREIVRLVDERMTSSSLEWAKDKLEGVLDKIEKKETLRPKNRCLIYSIGVNAQHLGFEMGIQHILTEEAERTIDGYEKGANFCDIHVFDPDGYHEKFVIDEGIQYHNWGISSSTSVSHGKVVDEGAEVKFKSFQETVKELGHEGHIIDVMKVDCKMCEWSIYEDWFDHGGKSRVDASSSSYVGLNMIQQLLVEVHGTPEKSVNAFFDRITDEGYVIFHKDANTEQFAGASQDYAFLKLAPEFFQ